MQRLTPVILALGILLGVAPITAAQEATPAASPGPPELGIEPAFSNQLLPGFGLPVVRLVEMGNGLDGVPDQLAAGRTLIELVAPPDSPAYVDFVQFPAGLTEDEAEEQLLLAARDDLAQEGWTYAGRSFALPGLTAHFVVDLPPGEWRIAATRESVPPEGGEVQEWATLHPIQVVPVGIPPATPAGDAPAVALTVEMRDVAFGGVPDELAAGPRIWEVTNVGTQPRQMILFRTPRLLDAADLPAVFAPMMGGTPVPGMPGFNEFVWVGYVAILSPGFTVWTEFDLAPGTYLVISAVIDPATGAPAMLLGMAAGFVVA